MGTLIIPLNIHAQKTPMNFSLINGQVIRDSLGSPIVIWKLTITFVNAINKLFRTETLFLGIVAELQFEMQMQRRMLRKVFVDGKFRTFNVLTIHCVYWIDKRRLNETRQTPSKIHLWTFSNSWICHCKLLNDFLP